MKTYSAPPLLIMPYEILQDERLSLRQIRVLMAIFSWRKKNTDLSRVSRQMLSERTGYPVNRISVITKELEAIGWIVKVGNGGKSQWNEYRINDLDLGTSNGYQNGNGCQNGNGYQNGTQTVTDSVPQTVTDLVRGIDTVRKDRNNTVKEKNKKESNVFIKPKIEEVQQHIDDMKIANFDVGYFYDYYESNGWMVGRVKMICWKSTIRNWIRRSRQHEQNGQTPKHEFRNSNPANEDF